MPSSRASTRDDGSRSPPASRPCADGVAQLALELHPQRLAARRDRAGAGARAPNRSTRPTSNWTLAGGRLRPTVRPMTHRRRVPHRRQPAVHAAARAPAAQRGRLLRAASTCCSPSCRCTSRAARRARGLATGAMMLATVVVELVAPRLIARRGYRDVLALGLLLLGAPSRPAAALPRAAARAGGLRRPRRRPGARRRRRHRPGRRAAARRPAQRGHRAVRRRGRGPGHPRPAARRLAQLDDRLRRRLPARRRARPGQPRGDARPARARSAAAPGTGRSSPACAAAACSGRAWRSPPRPSPPGSS